MKKKITIGAVSVIVILVVLLLVIPIDVFENLGKKGNTDSPEVVVQPDNSGDLESINDKIAKDNEERGDSGEEISTEESTEPYEVESYDKIDSIYAYVPDEIVELDNVSVYENLDFSNLKYNYNSYTPIGNTRGKNASLDLVKSILVEENKGYSLEVTDLVFIEKIDDFTSLCKLSKSNNDLLVVHNSGNTVDYSIFKDKGQVFSSVLVIDNLTVQSVDGLELIVYVYDYDKYLVGDY